MSTKRIEGLVARYLVTRIKAAPPADVEKWASRISNAGWHVFSRQRRVACANVARAFPEIDGKAAIGIARASFRHAAVALVDSIRMPERQPDFVWTSPDVLGPILAKKLPAIVISGHIGNWEAAGAAIATRGGRLHLIVATPTNPGVAALVHRLRAGWGVIPHAREKSLFPIARALRCGELVGTAVDQWPARHAVSATFLDRPTPFASGLFDYAMRTGVPMVAVWAIRTNQNTATPEYAVTTELVWDGEEPVHSAGDLVRRWVRMLESIIRRHPDQYLWMHERWKIRCEAR